MKYIEADLLLANIPKLDEKYKGESPERKKARSERYRLAYREYDSTWAELAPVIDKRAKGEIPIEEFHQQFDDIFNRLELRMSKDTK